MAELQGGMRSNERHEVRQLLSAFECLPGTREVAEEAGELRRRYRRSHSSISTPDYLIAANALVSGLPLATLNVRHFPMFSALTPPFPAPG